VGANITENKIVCEKLRREQRRIKKFERQFCQFKIRKQTISVDIVMRVDVFRKKITYIEERKKDQKLYRLKAEEIDKFLQSHFPKRLITL
jgi:hypothetical protein